MVISGLSAFSGNVDAEEHLKVTDGIRERFQLNGKVGVILCQSHTDKRSQQEQFYFSYGID